MQMQRVDKHVAGPSALDLAADESTGDDTFDIIDGTPDVEAASEQNGIAGAFSQPASQRPNDAATINQEALPGPQLLPAPQLEQHVLNRAVQPEQEATPSESRSETAAKVDGSGSGSLLEDRSTDNTPLLSMRSQDMPAPPQQADSAAQPSQQQQQAESKSRDESGAGRPGTHDLL